MPMISPHGIEGSLAGQRGCVSGITDPEQAHPDGVEHDRPAAALLVELADRGHGRPDVVIRSSGARSQ